MTGMHCLRPITKKWYNKHCKSCPSLKICPLLKKDGKGNEEKIMKKPWQTKEWREKRDEHLKGKCCIQCSSKERLTIHHPFKKNSLSNEQYMSFEGTKILCRRCAFAEHKGLNLCPKCKTNYKRKKYEMCFGCQFPKEVKKNE